MINIARELVSGFISNDEDVSLILELVDYVANKSMGFINNFGDLVDVDNVTEIFLPQLSSLVGYTVRNDVPIRYQREILKRYIEICKTRGTDDSIVMAATYGDYDLWVGGHLFYPNAVIDRTKSSLEYASESLFRYDVSLYDDLFRYTDSTVWREGILMIKLPYLNDKIRAAIKKNVPGGIKIYYQTVLDMSSEGKDVVDYGEWSASYTYISEEICALADMSSDLGFIFDLSNYDNKDMYSSEQDLYLINDEVFEINVSMIPGAKLDAVNYIDYDIEDFKLSTEYATDPSYGILAYDTKYYFDGYKTHEYISYAEIDKITPNMMYKSKAMIDNKSSEYIEFYNEGFEVNYKE